MKLNYINKIKANISLYSNKKTSNLLDGTYKSIYKGKSMNFENLREYVVNDDIKDIDWKSSARSGTVYVKQFIAEKKHNILLVMDSGIKMDADTNFHENKKNIALYTAGTFGYIGIKNNDCIGMIFSSKDKYVFKYFKNNLYNLDEYLWAYDKNNSIDPNYNIDDLLNYASDNILKRMIIIVITDFSGIDNIKTNTLKKIRLKHDLLVVNINDNYMFGDNIFDIESNNYIADFFLKDKKLVEIERNIRNKIISNNIEKLKKNNVCFTTISSIKEINNKVISLLEEHKYANRF